MQGRDKEIKERKIKEMGQNEQVICTISKYKIHISNQDLITQKGKKNLFQPTINIASNYSQKKRKGRKVKILVESSK